MPPFFYFYNPGILSMSEVNGYKSKLRVQEGISQPPNINPVLKEGKGRKRKKDYSPDEYVSGIISGNMTVLSQAITLLESSLAKHYGLAQAVNEKCLPYSGKSIRIGITGVPGAGKSTFIETFGLFIAEKGRKVAVLAIDPSSTNTRGSIMGDKTRMEKLGIHPGAFIRPSPSAGTLGGVAQKTRETIILCEAAGFDTVLVETVGVGQSETAVRTMVDFFLLLMLPGSGDELQGIKRGIIEMADAIAVTKADGTNKINADTARVSFENALKLFPLPQSGRKPVVVTCSAIQNTGIMELWDIITEHADFTSATGYFEELRKRQAVMRMNDTIEEYLKNSFYEHEVIKQIKPELEKQLYTGNITSYKAAVILLDKYFKK